LVNEFTKKESGRKQRFIRTTLRQETRAGGEAQEVEHLPSKCETLSSNPVLTTTTKNGGGYTKK
jgi:hypothetical protein